MNYHLNIFCFLLEQFKWLNFSLILHNYIAIPYDVAHDNRMNKWFFCFNQVTEIYSSGGDLHLELPSGSDDASYEHWVSHKANIK